METNRGAPGIEENLKKALVEMLVLALLHQREYYAPELSQALAELSGGAVNISFPYAILYRMIEQGYIQEPPKRKAPDGRRRQYYAITPAGRRYFQENWSAYRAFTAGVDRLVAAVCPEEEEETNHDQEAGRRVLTFRPAAAGRPQSGSGTADEASDGGGERLSGGKSGGR